MKKRGKEKGPVKVVSADLISKRGRSALSLAEETLVQRVDDFLEVSSDQQLKNTQHVMNFATDCADNRYRASMRFDGDGNCNAVEESDVIRVCCHTFMSSNHEASHQVPRKVVAT